MDHLVDQVLVPLACIWGLLLGAFFLLQRMRQPGGNRVLTALSRRFEFDLNELGRFSYHRLIMVSAAGLFLELVLVRWISAEIRIFSYFKNLVLVACFFGFGLGCYLSRRRVQLLNTIVPLLGFVLLFHLPWQVLHDFLLKLSDYIGGLADVHVWGSQFAPTLRLYAGSAVALSVVVPVIVLVSISMIPMGQMVAHYLEIAPFGISAYSANIAASVCGIWVFTGLSFLSTPPAVWLLALWLGLLMFWPLRRLRAAIAIGFAILVLILVGGHRTLDYHADKLSGAPAAIRGLNVVNEKTYWSPYQKLSLTALSDGKQLVRYMLDTNGSWYQEIMNLSPEFVEAHPQYYDGDVALPYFRYNFPYRFVNSPEKVLILGSGMGNDVAAALRNYGQHVVAVEIDPLIARLGREYHFEHPYNHGQVKTVIDDARSYLQNTDERFDLVVSSILDSHVTQSSFTNIRTDNYVYTRQGLALMLGVLKPGGVLCLSFSGERPWFAGRLKDLLTDVSGRPPLMIHNSYTFFLVGAGITERLAKDPFLAAFVASRTNVPIEAADSTTDDWPYFYQRKRGVPVIVILLEVLLALISWSVLRKSGLRLRNLHWHFFFLGAGFMLLEVQIISKVALLFGTTWLTNSLVITALLVLILLANATVKAFGRSVNRIAYSGLLVTLALGFLTPMDSLLFHSLVLRLCLSTLFLCLPVYFAGLIFISSFEANKFQAEAFGANLLGAVVGGLLEALSFWTGIRSLLVIAAVCYLMSCLVRQSPIERAAVADTAIPVKA